MDFYRLKEIPPRTHGDVAFRYPAGPAVPVLAAAALGLNAVCFGVGPAQAVPPQYRTWAGFAALGLVGFALLLVWARRFRNTGWLARITGTGLVIKFRSPRNHRSLSKGDVVAFRLPWHEIAWAIPAGGAEHGGRLTHLEMKLRTGDQFPLKMHLANERGRKPSGKRHWWGGRMSVAPHHPVHLQNDNVLRLEWKVRPGLKRAVELIRAKLDPNAVPAPAAAGGAARAPGAVATGPFGEPIPPGAATPPARGAAAYPSQVPLPEPAQLEHILSMARRGDMMGAYLAASHAFGLADPDAERLVEALAAGEVEPHNARSVTAFLLKAASRERLLKWAERGEVKAVEGALMRDHHFPAETAHALGETLAHLPPDKARRRLEEALAQGPASVAAPRP
jgi:hypothetical protein